MCTINEDHMILWFLKYKVQLTEMFVMSFFALSAPLTTQKIKILKLKKKTTTTGDIIVLHICIINDNYVIYDS